MFTNFDVRRRYHDTINKDGKTINTLSRIERNTLFVSSKLCLARYRDLSFTIVIRNGKKISFRLLWLWFHINMFYGVLPVLDQLLIIKTFNNSLGPQLPLNFFSRKSFVHIFFVIMSMVEPIFEINCNVAVELCSKCEL